MAIDFDGDNLIVTLDTPTGGTLNQDVEVDWYNAWKDWQLESSANRKYPPVFFDSFGGNNIVSGLDAGAYFIFQNNRGWRMRPFEANQTIYVTGNIVPGDSTLPIAIPTIGAYTVMFDGLQQQTQIAETGTSGLTSEESTWLSSVPNIEVDIDFLKASLRGEKVLEKVTDTWYLVIYNTDSPRAEITRKALKDANGNEIDDLAAGALAKELESSV